MRSNGRRSPRTIVRERLALAGVHTDDIRYDLIGVSALHGPGLSGDRPAPYEVRLRVAAPHLITRPIAQQIGNEVESLYTNGPAGGGGAMKSAREVLSVASTFVPRSVVTCRVHRQVVT